MDTKTLLALHNILSERDGRTFVRWLLNECGVDVNNGISFRSEKTAHELGLDLLHRIMYNEIDKLGLIISEQKALEVNNGRGNRDTDDGGNEPGGRTNDRTNSDRASDNTDY